MAITIQPHDAVIGGVVLSGILGLNAKIVWDWLKIRKNGNGNGNGKSQACVTVELCTERHKNLADRLDEIRDLALETKKQHTDTREELVGYRADVKNILRRL